MANEAPGRNSVDRLGNFIFNIIDTPVTWFKENVVLPNQKKYPYYHRKYNRVPTIDECEELDVVCMFEANEQYKRDKAVDRQIVALLKRRKEACVEYEGPDYPDRCMKTFEDYDLAQLNYFIKYGDLSYFAHVRQVYMKQKHRMVYERRKAEGKI